MALHSHLKNRIFSGLGTSKVSIMYSNASRNVTLLITLFGKKRVNCSCRLLSHTTSSHNFLPRPSNIGREQKSSSHSLIVSTSASSAILSSSPSSISGLASAKSGTAFAATLFSLGSLGSPVATPNDRSAASHHQLFAQSR